MDMKTIYLSEEVYNRLSLLALESENYNDFIARLIDVYENSYFDELSDAEADFYNERIKHFENGDYEGTRKVDLKFFGKN